MSGKKNKKAIEVPKDKYVESYLISRGLSSK